MKKFKVEPYMYVMGVIVVLCIFYYFDNFSFTGAILETDDCEGAGGVLVDDSCVCPYGVSTDGVSCSACVERGDIAVSGSCDVLGDLDRDGVLGPGDVGIIQLIITHNEDPDACGDIDMDGVIGPGDVGLLQAMIAGTTAQIFYCPVVPVCRDGEVLDVISNVCVGVPVVEEVVVDEVLCPQYVSPSADFCSDGTVVSGGEDDDGCQLPGVCVPNDAPAPSGGGGGGGSHVGTVWFSERESPEPDEVLVDDVVQEKETGWWLILLLVAVVAYYYREELKKFYRRYSK